MVASSIDIRIELEFNLRTKIAVLTASVIHGRYDCSTLEVSMLTPCILVSLSVNKPSGELQLHMNLFIVSIQAFEVKQCTQVAKSSD